MIPSLRGAATFSALVGPRTVNYLSTPRTMSSAATTSQEVSVKHSTIDGVNVPPMAIGALTLPPPFSSPGSSSFPADQLCATTLMPGTWSWGDTRTWKYKEEDLSGVKEAWSACNKAGLTFYDTAWVYAGLILHAKSVCSDGTMARGLVGAH